MALPNPIIVVPGITASALRDEYPVSPDMVWGILSKDAARIALHPDNVAYERLEPARVVADQVFTIPYDELILELRHNLTEEPDKPVPVYPFAYDWRQPLETAADRLAAFIGEVIERTKLLRHYHDAGYGNNPRVDLVGHSMGGMIIAGSLAKMAGGTGNTGNVRVGKVATIASPFRGSVEAILKVTIGQGTLGTGQQSSREREAARLTPALYYLAPSFDGALVDKAGSSVDIFKPQSWQASIIDTIAKYIRFYGLKTGNPQQRALDLMGRMLSEAEAYRAKLESFRLADVGLTDADWLCIVGVGTETQVRLRLTMRDGKPDFFIDKDDRADKWRSRTRSERINTGDGTVPYLGARCSFIPVERVVCLAPEDFEAWEIGDKFLASTIGFHGILPKMNVVHRLIISHFTGKLRRNTWGRPAPDLTGPTTGAKPKWNPPIAGLEPPKD